MYDNIILEKGLYNICGKTFTEALRELDADENYAGTELEGLDPFERQLKRFDIKVSGADSDRVEKFFSTTQSAILFPEFVRRCIKAGMDRASVLPHIVAATTYTDGADYRGISVTDSDSSLPVATVEAGKEFPKTTVGSAESTVSVAKYGRQIQAVYEVIRKQRLDLFGVILKAVGAQVSENINKAAAAVLMNGVSPTETAANAIAYSDLASFWGSMTDRSMTAMLVAPDLMADILALEEMKNCGGDIGSGAVDTPFGVKLVKCAGLDAGTAIGVDSGSALEAVLGTDVVVDSDKLISAQIDCITFSVNIGFSKIYPSAVKVLKLKAE